MRKSTRYCMILVALLCFLKVKTQTDSLQHLLAKDLHDSVRLKILTAISESCSEDSIQYYTQPALKLCDELLEKYPGQERYFSLLKSELYINEAYFLEYKGDYKGAISVNMKNLAVLEKHKDPFRLSSTFNNLGSLYLDEQNFKKALEYFHKCLSLRRQLGDSATISNALGNIGSVHYRLRSSDSALYYYRLVEKLVPVRAFSLKGSVNNNIGSVYSQLGQFDTALVYLNKALEIWKANDITHVPICLCNIGDIYFRKNETRTAIRLGEEAYELALKHGRPFDIISAANLLKKAYSKDHNFEKALYYYEQEKIRQDSLVNDETKQALTRAQMQYEYDKKTAIAEVKRREKESIAEGEQRRLNLIIYSISAGLIALILLSVYIFNGYRQNQKSHTEISRQKKVIEEKQKEILDSIHYAKRIQESLLPTEKYISQKIINRKQA